MAWRCFNNIRLFMTVRHICPWKHQIISKKDMGIKEPPFGVYFHCGKVSHWARNCPCLDSWQYGVQIGQAGYKRRQILNFANARWKSPSKFLLPKMSFRYFRPVSQIWLPQHCTETLGDCPGSQTFCCFNSFGSCLLCTFCPLR